MFFGNVSCRPCHKMHIWFENTCFYPKTSLSSQSHFPFFQPHPMPYSRNQPLISKRMAVNILGHAAYQMVMIFGMLWGPSLVPCYKQCWTSEDPKNISQVATTVFQVGVAPNDKWDGGVANPSEHFTVIFNAFVMMQIFNEINARKIHGERSVFKGIFDNPLFYGIVIGTLVTQVLIIEMAGVVFACTSLSVAQWMFCTCVGLFELIWQQFICFVPDTVLDSCFAPKVSKVWLKVGWGLIFPTFRVFQQSSNSLNCFTFSDFTCPESSK